MTELILFIIILSVLILSHEFGHFIAAKRTGMRVDEFGIGFPPKLLKFKKGETTYSLNLIPFGGFVKIHGEDYDGKKGDDDKRTFTSKSKLAQAIVVSAGVVFNFILAWLLLATGYMIGFPTPIDQIEGGVYQDQHIIITSVVPGTPAEVAGIKAGDRIVSVTEGGVRMDILHTDELVSYINSKEGREITVAYRRGETEGTLLVTPESGILEDRSAIGVTMETVAFVRLAPHKAIYEAGERTLQLIWSTAKILIVTIKDIFVGRTELAVISGPIGIYTFVGDVNELGLIYILSFTAIISISLGIINLFPFPALDGGRLLFIIIESIKRSPINPKIATSLNYIGFALLIFLMLIISYNDLMKVGILN